MCDKVGAIFTTWRCSLRNVALFIASLAILALSNSVQAQQPPLTQAGSANATSNTPSPDNDGVYQQGPGIVAPVLVHPFAVAGGRELIDKCAPRTVVIPAVINGNGAVGLLGTGQPGQPGDFTCDPPAIDAVERSSFQAGTLDNKSIPVLVCLGVSFVAQAKGALPTIQPCPENLSTTTFDGHSIYRAGSAVKVPVLTFQPDAEFSDEARRKHYQGVCIIALIVDPKGNPQNAHVIRALGMGLDQKAMEAVRRYRFKPATFDGKPVPVLITVEIDFHLYQRPN